MSSPAKPVATFSSVEQIRERFDHDVERFSSLETGQAAAMDSPLCTGLIARAAVAMNPDASHGLDVGCGAGNYTLTWLGQLGRRDVQCDLLDLSRPMLDRAAVRVGQMVETTPVTIQTDVRQATLQADRYDVILAAAVLHHLRTDQEWDAVYGRLFASLKPGGTLWIYDLIAHDQPTIASIMRDRHAEYLESLHGQAYRDKVFAYMQEEDTPRSLADQCQRMRQTGFEEPIVLHVNATFAAFGARRPRKQPGK